MTPAQLDDLFRANEARAGFAPQPGDWEEMRALLEEDERRGGAAQWVSAAWLLLFVGLIVGGVVGAVRYAPTGAGAGGRLSPKPEAAAFDHLRVAPQDESTYGRPAARRQSNGAHGADAAFDHLRVAPRVEVDSERPAARRQSNGADAAHAAFDHLRVAPRVEVDSGRPAARRQSNGALAYDRLALLPISEFCRKPTLPGGLPHSAVTPPRPPLELRALLALEANEVEMDGPLAFGALVGLGAQYHLTEDWSVGAAALIGKKNYVAGPDQIHMPKDVFVDKVMPSETSVDATILQFPLNLTYSPQRPAVGARTWFASATLNSFQLLQDRLDFTYPEARPGQVTSMTDARPGGSFAASVRVGGGFSVKPRELPRLYVGPYFELPLKRTGYSEVSLYTLGLQLQVGF